MPKTLLINHEPSLSASLARDLKRAGHDFRTVPTMNQGLMEVAAGRYSVVIVNAHLPDGSGIDAVPALSAAASRPEVIVVADQGDPTEAEQAINNEAWDYLAGPSIGRLLFDSILQILKYRAIRQPLGQDLVQPVEPENRIIGGGPRMRACLDQVAEAAASQANVLLLGETGTGKGLLAKAIHDSSPVSAGKFVVVDCTALPEQLVESLLFGHRKGSFTGAEESRIGLIKQADGGTLFLDEVGDLDQPLQKSFLRVLHEGRFRPLGAEKEYKSDFRIVAASNQDLGDLVRRGRFRKDLLFRLRAFSIELPPLRERTEDLDELTSYYLARLAREYSVEPKKCSPRFVSVLKKYGWPGNVRELIHALERAIVSAGSEPILFPKHLPNFIRGKVARRSVSQGPAPDRPAETASSLPTLADVRRATLADVERNYLDNLLRVTRRDISRACKISGLSRPRLYALLKKYGFTGRRSYESE